MMIVTPILLFTVAAIFDFGVLFRSWSVVTNAAREGARVGVLPDYSCDQATPDDVQSRVNPYMRASGFSDPSAYLVTMAVRQPVGADFNACAVRVDMDQLLPSLGVFAPFFGGSFGSVPVVALAEMRTEAQGASAP